MHVPDELQLSLAQDVRSAACSILVPDLNARIAGGSAVLSYLLHNHVALCATWLCKRMDLPPGRRRFEPVVPANAGQVNDRVRRIALFMSCHVMLSAVSAKFISCVGRLTSICIPDTCRYKLCLCQNWGHYCTLLLFYKTKYGINDAGD